MIGMGRNELNTHSGMEQSTKKLYLQNFSHHFDVRFCVKKLGYVQKHMHLFFFIFLGESQRSKKTITKLIMDFKVCFMIPEDSSFSL